LRHIALSMEHAISAKPVTGALGQPATRVLVLAGHDTNIAHIAGLLNLSWLNGHSVEVLYIAQTLEQLRQTTPLSLASPPGIAPVFVPGCATSGKRLDCEWPSFLRILSRAIDLKQTVP
jgi:4-phytase/acid phosphatase